MPELRLQVQLCPIIDLRRCLEALHIEKNQKAILPLTEKPPGILDGPVASSQINGITVLRRSLVVVELTPLLQEKFEAVLASPNADLLKRFVEILYEQEQRRQEAGQNQIKK